MGQPMARKRLGWILAAAVTVALLVIAWGQPAYAADNASIDISTAKIMIDDNDCVYDGSKQEPYIEVMQDGRYLDSWFDYDVAYSNNVNAGTATVKITGKGAYAGAVTKQFKIQPLSISDDWVTVSVSKARMVYTGKVLKPSVTVTMGRKVVLNKAKKSKGGFKITYSKKSPKKIGKYTVTIKGTGNYKGTVKETFWITPKAPKFKIQTVPGGFKVKLTKKVSGVSGYQISWASGMLPNNYDNYYWYKKVGKGTKVTGRIWGDSNGDVVWVRSYKKVGKSTIYSPWSKPKQAWPKSL